MVRNRLLIVVLSLAILLIFHQQYVVAEIVIEAGDHALLPNTPNQTVNILISSDPSDSDVSGTNLRVELGDGTGALSEPVFQGTPGSLDGFDFSSSIFAGNPASGQGPVAGFPQLINGGITTGVDVGPNGIFVTLLIDTTGFGTPGSVFPLRLGSFVSAFPGDAEVLGPIGNAIPIPVTINNGQLSIVNPATLAGDYNGNGTVDAADYTVWRDSLGQVASLGTGADGDGSGIIDAPDYDVWELNFGLSLSAISGARTYELAAIPEPTSLCLILLGLTAIATRTKTVKTW